MTSRFACAALAASALLARTSGAQSFMAPSVELSVTSRDAASAADAGPAVLIAPSLRVDRPWATALLRTEADVGEHAARLHTVDATASVEAARFGRLRAELTGGARHDGIERGVPTSVVGGQLRLHVSSPTRGVWAGGGMQRVWASRIGRSTPLASIGAWLRHRGLTLTGDVTYARLPEFVRTPDSDTVPGAFPDTLDLFSPSLGASQPPPESLAVVPPPGPGGPTPHRGGPWRGTGTPSTEAQVALQWNAGRLELRGLAGSWFGGTGDRQSWASANATVWLTSNVAVVASGGRRPLGPATGGVSSQFATLGLRLARWPLWTRATPVVARAASRSFRVTRHGGQATLEVRAAGATRVELRGDLTEWSAVAMSRSGDDRWIVELPLRPGVYHITLRIDGGSWMPPPGLPTMPDGYDGLAGILVVE